MPSGFRGNLKHRFYSKVRLPTGPGECWEWLGAKNPNGYGNMTVNQRSINSHRAAYKLLVGEIPPGRVIDHICFNRGCVNPEHLRAVTQQQNAQRTSPRGRFRGVYQLPDTGRYQARVNFGGRQHTGGCFDTPEEAALVAWELRQKLFSDSWGDERYDEANPIG